MRRNIFWLLLIVVFLGSCEHPEEPEEDLYPYLIVDYRFTDEDVVVFSRKLAIANDLSAVYYTGESVSGAAYHIYKRPLSYVDHIVQMSSGDGAAIGAYAVDLDILNQVYYQQAREIAPDSVLHYIMRADPGMELGDPEPEELLSFNGNLVGFDEYEGRQADFFSVSADGYVYIIGYDDTGFYYLNFRDEEPIVFSLPTAIEAVLAPDGQKYVWVDGSSNIYLSSTLLENPVLIGNGRYASISSNNKVGWVNQNLLHVYDISTQEVKKYYPPKNVASAEELMNATLAENGEKVAFRFYDASDSDIVMCSIPE